jgi:hypothetical protein
MPIEDYITEVLEAIRRGFDRLENELLLKAGDIPCRIKGVHRTMTKLRTTISNQQQKECLT